MSVSSLSIIKIIFAHKHAALITILLALLNKVFISYVNFSLVGDKSLYTMMSLNAISGHGFTETLFFFQQPDTPYYLRNPAIDSPGYSFLLIPFLLLTGKNILMSTLCVDALGWLILILSVRQILKQCDCPPYLVNLATFMTGFFLYPHEFMSGPKDTLAVGLLWAGTSYIISIITRQHHTWKTGIVAGFLATLPGIVKLLYKPLAFSILLVLPIAGLYKKEKKPFVTFIWSLGTTILLFYLLKSWVATIPALDPAYPDYQKWSIVSGEFTRGFFSTIIQFAYPFILSAFVNVDFIGVQAEKILHVTYPQAWKVFQIINWLCLAWLVTRCTSFFLRLRGREVNKKSILLMTGGLVSFSLLSVLTVLSVTHTTIRYKGGGLFAFVSEGRSYFYTMIFLQLLCFVYLFQKPKLNALISGLKKILMILLALSVLHGIYFTIKNISRIKIQVKTQHPASNSILKIIREEQKKRPGKKVRLITQMQHLRWIGLLHGDTIYCNPANLEKQPVALPENTVFISAVFKEDTVHLRRYIQQPDVKVLQVQPEIILLVQE